MQRLPYVSEPVEEKLLQEIAANLPRYRGDGFGELATRPDWAIECKYEFDSAPLRNLGPDTSDYEGSLFVWQALSTLPVSLACEARIWTRLSHVECFKYSKHRWLTTNGTDEQVTDEVRTHFFARTLTARRDDNAIARLWWSASIASRIAGQGDISETLRLITKTADIRSNVVERTMMMSRPVLARAVVDAMRSIPAVCAKEETFREFMKTLNRTGGGIVFERLASSEVAAFVENCARRSLPA